MSIDADPLMSLAALSRALGPVGRSDNRFHPATFTRWIGEGRRRVDGTRERMRAVRAGGKWLVRLSWVISYMEALAAGHLTAQPEPTRTPTERSAAADAAGRELERLGA